MIYNYVVNTTSLFQCRLTLFCLPTSINHAINLIKQGLSTPIIVLIILYNVTETKLALNIHWMH